MGRYWQWYLDKTWRSIWWWRIIAVIAWVFTIVILLQFFELLTACKECCSLN